MFLPAGCRGESFVSMYVERAFPGGQSQQPGAVDVDRYVESVVDELQAREYIGRAEVVDLSWVDVAYTWRSPDPPGGSAGRSTPWSAAGIQQVGRYGRWQFQGIADSIHEGLEAGSAPADEDHGVATPSTSSGAGDRPGRR